MQTNIMVCPGDLPANATFPNGYMAVDTETLGLNIKRDRLCVCQVSDGNGNVWVVTFDGTAYHAPNLKKHLEDKNLLKIFHFGRFDIAVLYHYLGVLTAPVYCTKIVSKLVRTYTDRHGLKDLCQEMTGISLDKQQQTSYWAAAELSPAQLQYAANDVLYLGKIKEALDQRLKDGNRTHLAQACFDFLPTRALLDLNGWDEVDIFTH